MTNTNETNKEARLGGSALNEGLEREAFEKWFTGEDSTKTRRAMMELNKEGFYIYQSAYNAWNVWKARANAHVYNGEYICGKCRIRIHKY